jgi:hypothetical protein
MGQEIIENVGAIVSCGTKRFLEACIELDQQRLMALDATLDLEMICNNFAVIPIICAGKQAGVIGEMPQRDRFHWLVAPRSTIIQTSKVHTGMCQNLSAVLDHLINTMVLPSRLKPDSVETGLVAMKKAPI